MTGNHPDSGPRVTSYEGLRKLLDHRRVPPKVLSHDEYVALSPSARSGGPYPRNVDTGLVYAAVGSVAAQRASKVDGDW